MRIPRKKSLVQETYDILLESIRDGVWDDFLPGERSLCERFQISRLTLRQALKQLVREGVISSEQGKQRRILLPGTGRSMGKAQKSVGYLCSIPTLEMPGYASRSLAVMERIFHQSGIDFQIFARPGCYSRSPGKALKKLVGESNIEYWIVQQSPLEVQAWFQEKGIPAIIAGTTFEGINLPFVDLDNAAVCRHAVGRLIAKKRKNICFLATTPIFAGDIRSENGFMEAIRADKSVTGKVVRSNGTPDGIRQKVSTVLGAQRPPDAFLVDKSSHAYTVIGLLMTLGLRVPKDISVICRTESIDFQYMTPTVAHYSRNIPEVAGRIAELALKLVSGETVRDKGIFLFPDFVPGKSL